MYFDRISELPKIAARTSCTIFVPQNFLRPKLSNALFLEPDGDKKTPVISVEQIRDFIACATSRESADRFFVIMLAETMTSSAANAFLKTLEEPGEFCHFVLITKNPSLLLPTIRSRSQLFIERLKEPLNTPPKFSVKTMDLAKKLVTVRRATLSELATELAAKKNRQTVLDAVSAAIEILYKTYFKTGNTLFLAKLPGFLNLYDALNQNGHVKLQIVANLL